MNSGMIIVLLGPDGSGKTTFFKKAKSLLSKHFDNISYFHLRPRLFEARNINFSVPTTNPHGKNDRNLFFSYLKIIYFIIDYNFGYFFKIKKLKKKGHLIFFDRYIHDFLIDPKRYRYNSSKFLVNLASYLIPKPDLFLIFDAPEELIFSRKKELSIDEIKRQRNSYKSFALLHKNSIIIDTSKPVNLSVKNTCKLILDFFNK